MSHEMLTLQGNLLNGHEAICVWAVIENWSVDEESGHNELLYANNVSADAVQEPENAAYKAILDEKNYTRDNLEKLYDFDDQLAVEANEGCIYRWKDREDFQFERNPLSYECWLDGDYCGNHYEIFLEEKPVIRGSASKRSRKNL